jgi:hypothetical protein
MSALSTKSFNVTFAFKATVVEAVSRAEKYPYFLAKIDQLNQLPARNFVRRDGVLVAFYQYSLQARNDIFIGYFQLGFCSRCYRRFHWRSAEVNSLLIVAIRAW